MPKKKVAIGIDLGTSKCCVGVVHNGRVEILENERGNKTTPSYVAFTGTERLVGEDAKDQAILNPSSTVSGVKKLLGQTFDSPEVQRYVPDTLPFAVFEDGTGKPEVRLTYKKKEIKLLPEQISAMLLGKMKDLVETRLDCVVEEAVISVPASFTNTQRQATKDAAAIAGLKVMALVNETTAAAIAYQANRKGDDKETIAVVDFGGGKLDVSVVSVKKDAVEVEATFGSSLVGGIDIDEQLVRILIEKFKMTHNADLSSNAKAKERLRCACVSLKHTLSLLPESHVQLDSLYDDKDLNVTFTRKDFEKVVGKRIRKVFTRIVQRVLSDILVQGLTISRVLLVGGTTRIPMVQKLLLENFRFCRLDRSVNPDEAVAQGAALMTAFSKLRVHDITLHAFYLDQGNGRLPLFEKFNSVPDSRNVQVRCHGNSLVEWQYKMGGSCGNVLSRNLTGDSSRTMVKFKFSIDSCGILQATVIPEKGSSKRRIVTNGMTLVSERSIKEMINVEKRFKFDSMDECKRISALSNLESYYFGQKSYLEAQHRKQKLSESTFEMVSQKLKEILTWIDSSPDATIQDYEDKETELEKLCTTSLMHVEGIRAEEKKMGSPRSRSQSGKENTVRHIQKGEREQELNSSLELSDRKVEVDSPIEGGTEPFEVELLKNSPELRETLNAGGRVKRARTEPEGQEDQQRNDGPCVQTWETSESGHQASTERKRFCTTDSVEPSQDSFARSSFRDYPPAHSEAQARTSNPGTASKILRTCKQVLGSAQESVQRELGQQLVYCGSPGKQFSCSPSGKENNCAIRHEAFNAKSGCLGAELVERNGDPLRNRHSLDPKLEADIDDLVDEFADNVRKDLKNLLLSTEDTIASYGDETNKYSF